jgi:hypothetical protein
LGYKQGVKGVTLYDLNSKETFVSRNVVHHDHILPYTPSTTSPNWHYHLSYTLPLPNDQADTALPLPVDQLPYTTSQVTQPLNDPDISPTENDTSNASSPDNRPSQNPISTRPVRTKQMPSYLSDYVCNQTSR